MKQIFAASIPKLVGVILIGFYSGCSVLDPAEDIPSYLHIDSITLSVQSDEGSSSAKISDAWVFMDGKLLGGFELPCNIPILAEGTHSFLIRGGVKMNGLSSTRAIYPGWKGWEGSVNLVRGQKTAVAPVVTYFPAIDFLGTWMLDFDQQGTSLIPEPTTSAVVKVDSLYNVYENNCGYIHLNNNDTSFFWGTSPPNGYLMPATTDTWVEFDYWSDCPFSVGIAKNADINYKVEALTVLPRYTWTKIYIRLTDALSAALAAGSGYNPASTPYRIYIGFNNPSSQSESHLYIDNIKLLK
jgi:hypothetical protein